MLRWMLILPLLLCLTGCVAASLPAPDTAAADPAPLVVSPAGITPAPLPRGDAERVFRWPTAGTPSLIFIYDSEAT